MRKPKRDQSHDQAALDNAALQKENLRLCRVIAQMKAEAVTARHSAMASAGSEPAALTAEDIEREIEEMRKAAREPAA